MPEATIAHVTGLLTAESLQGFLHLDEGPWFEAKGPTPYNLEAPSGRYELAKDVSAFANADGGHLVIGLATQRLENRPTDRVTAFDLLDTDAFPTTKYLGIVNSHVHPNIDNLAVRVFRRDRGSPLGLAVVFVPPQHHDRKPFLVTRIVEDSEVQKAVVVCIARRIGASSDPLSPQRLHDALRKGQDSHSQRLTRMETTLTTILERLSVTAPAPADETTIRSRIDDILRVEP